MATLIRRKLWILGSIAFMIVLTVASQAQVKRVDLTLSGFLCNNECRFEIDRALKPFADDLTAETSFEKRRVTLTPKEGVLLQLWDIRSQLQGIDRSPVRITVLAVGEIEDYSVAYPNTHLHTRKALVVRENGLTFMLQEGPMLDELLAFAKTQPDGKVAILGEVPAFSAKHQPILVIRGFKASKAQWTEEEINPPPKKKA